MHLRFLFRHSDLFFFFFNDPAPPEISPLPLHDALPISGVARHIAAGVDYEDVLAKKAWLCGTATELSAYLKDIERRYPRSEEHTSELQSLAYLVCRLLLEKKKNSNSHHQSKHSVRERYT